MPRAFIASLWNCGIALVINYSIWFAATFWIFLETKSVIASSITSGLYLVLASVSSFFLGSLVDRYKQHRSMLFSCIGSLTCYSIASLIFFITLNGHTITITNPWLWTIIVLILLGNILGNLRAIALSTLVTLLIADGQRSRANGLIGAITGVAATAASAISGITIGYFGMGWMLLAGVIITLLLLFHLLSIQISPANSNTSAPSETQQTTSKIDIAGTIRTISAIPGLWGLLFFQSINNIFSGLSISILDPYGLSFVSVQVWGFLWTILNIGMILGGLYVARRGLYAHPLKVIFQLNALLWFIGMVFTLRSSILLLSVCTFIFMLIIPFIEAAEQTLLQRVVPAERQGRVFGFAQSLEQSASPITAFLIGPLTKFFFIPFMTDGLGAQTIGPWFGTGFARGIALVFCVSGLIGLIITLFLWRSRSYQLLHQRYNQQAVTSTPQNN
jgi:DHA3 family multidrug efflux protein-like MFS transporter